MVEIEIRTPLYNEESEQIELQPVALVRVDEGGVTTFGDQAAVTTGTVLSVSKGSPVHPDDDPEDWARSLPAAYQSGDYVAVLIRDDNPAQADSEVVDLPEPEIPEAPQPAYSDDRQPTLH